jgi:tRNA U34 5-carboxymethylaminomethyl modifying GTPase MnmE/TrmE
LEKKTIVFFKFIALEQKVDGYTLAYISNDLLKEFFPTLNLRVRFNSLKERLKKKYSINNDSFEISQTPSNQLNNVTNATVHQIQLLFSPNQNDITSMNPSESIDIDPFSNNMSSSNNHTESASKCPQMIEFPMNKLRANLRKILEDPNTILGKAEHNELIETVFNELLQHT